MKSIDKYFKYSSTVKIRFATEKDRTSGVYELFNSSDRSSCVGNHEYIVGIVHLRLFEDKGIRYRVIGQK